MLDHLPDGPFALIRRADEDSVELLEGPVEEFELLADLPTEHDELLALVPYRQLRERGDACYDDGAPLLAMRIISRGSVEISALPEAITPVLRDGAFDVDDDTYGRAVKTILDEEIGAGEGSNFVLRRTFVGQCDDARATAYGAFRALLSREKNAYWTFLIDTGRGLLVGATPERHVSLRDGVAVMNPISGTFREPPATAPRERVLAFLADPKEREELAMVVDEELKMLAEVGDLGGRVVGPFLKEMANLAHTEYYIEARTTLDPRAILRTTMFAPTATGSPLRNALRVIDRHETGGRGYYGAVAALIGRDAAGEPTMDAPLLLRVAYLDPDGTVRVPVGATLVRGSDAPGEVRETYAKAAGVLRAFGVDFGSMLVRPAAGQPAEAETAQVWSRDPEVTAVLAARNANLSPFWRTAHAPGSLAVPELRDRRVLIIDNEDAFTSMLAVQLRALGLAVVRTPFDEVRPADLDAADLVVLGPGPGDPRDTAVERIAAVRGFARELLAECRPVLGVCLGHQALCLELGFEVRRLPLALQGTQHTLDLFGADETVAFYNSFAAEQPAAPVLDVRTALIPGGPYVAAMRGPAFGGIQFHPESILTLDGLGVLRREIGRLVAPA